MASISPGDAVFSFDVAYALYPGYTDRLEILISLDCGKTYTTVYSKMGSELATAPDTTNQFEPANDQWRNDTIDLSPYIGNSNVYVKFRNINGYGQALYVDNINLGGETLSLQDQDLETMLLYPNPVTNNGTITIQTKAQENLKFSLFNIQGKQIAQLNVSSNTQIPLHNLELSTGLYLYTIRSANRITKGKLLVSDSRN